MRFKKSLFVYSATAVLAFVLSAIGQQVCSSEQVCLKVVAQRWLTKTDQIGQDPLSTQTIAVRLSLTNNSGKSIWYLTGLNSVEPLGYRLFRKIGETEWSFLPKTARRSEILFQASGISANYKYLRLPPGTSVLYEERDWGKLGRNVPAEEHMFSAFIKFKEDDKAAPVELESDPFQPLEDQPK